MLMHVPGNGVGVTRQAARRRRKSVTASRSESSGLPKPADVDQNRKYLTHLPVSARCRNGRRLKQQREPFYDRPSHSLI